MVQKLRSRFAAMKDVPTKLSATMFVCGMELSERGSILAAMKDVITKQCKDESVCGMEQSERRSIYPT